jgi:uncharacterized protein with LGFP repeats
MMDANNTAVEQFGEDPTGLKLDQTPSIGSPNNQQFSSQAWSSIQTSDSANTAQLFTESNGYQDTTIVDLQKLVQSAVLPLVQSKLQELYGRPDWAEILKTSFGDGVNLVEGRELLGKLAVGQGMLPVRVVQTVELEAQGAFGNNEIFLGDKFVRAGDLQAIAQVVVEEIGHSLDRQINLSDAVGDEGEIFADLVFGQTLDGMRLEILRAEDDSTIRAIDGQRLTVEMSAFPIQGSIRNFYYNAPNLAQILKEPTTAEAYVANGVWRQDFQGGVIIHSNIYGSHAVKGSILSFYQGQGAQSGALGVPLTEEIATSYGWRQDFQGGTVIHSPQYGSQLVKGSVGNYYRGLPEAQRNQLGAPYTPENSLGGGNWRQFFNGGTVEWKNNGTGEVKFTPYSIGSNGSSINVAFTNKFNEVDGWVSLGNSTGNVRAVTGGTVQDFEKGSIYQSAAGTFAVRGSIGVYYRANSAALGLGLPTSEEVATSYGWRQDFQGGTVIHSPQYGSQLVKGSLGNYYKGLSELQRNQLGAPYTLENSLGGGNWRQFFKGGTVEWKNNGTGEVKFAPYSIGLNGNVINQVVLDKFNQANGWDTLGNPLNALQSYAGGLVQDFERGIIFQSAAGIFVARGAFGDLYRTKFAITGLPTGDEVVTSFGVRQNFGNKIAFSTPQFGTQILLDNVATFYRGLTDAQRDSLGAPYSGEMSLGNGNSRQFFKGGVIDWKANGTGELKLTPFAIGVNGNAVNQVVLDKFNQANGWDTLGKPLNALQSYAGGLVQDFERGIIFQSAAGTFVARGAFGDLYRTKFAITGLPSGDEVVTSFGVRQNFGNKIVFFTTQFGTQILLDSIAGFYRSLTDVQREQLGAPYSGENNLGGGNTRQFFKGGVIDWKANGTGELKLTSFAIGLNGNVLNQVVLDKFNQANGWDTLGKPLNALQSYAGGLVQDFERGIIFQSAAGTFVARGAIGELYRYRFAVIGLPTSDEVVTSFGGRQKFGNKIVLSSPQFGAQILLENVAGFYNSLTEQQRNQLGAAYTGEQALVGGNSRQYFQGGTIEWKANGTGEVKIAPYPIGVNGNAVNQVVLDRFNQASGWDTLGKPLNALQSYAGGLVQDFERGIIFQSAAGTFVARGAFGELYRTKFALTGLPTGDEVVTSFGVRQNFGNKIVFSTPQFGTQILLDKIATFYRGLTDVQREQLGAPSAAEKDLGGGNSSQDFQGGAIEWKSNDTGEMKLNSFPIYTALVNKYGEINGLISLGKATGNLRVAGNGATQDFEKGNIFASSSGIFAVRGEIGAFHKANFANFGIPTSEQIATSNGFKQDFEKGIIFQTSNGIFVVQGDTAAFYKANGTVFSLGLPIRAETVTSYRRQDFQGGIVINGKEVIRGTLATLYRSLTDAQRETLGVPLSFESGLNIGGYRQFFQGGTLAWKPDGTREVKFTPYPIGLDGSDHNLGIAVKFNQVCEDNGWDFLGNPIGVVKTLNGVKSQDFEKGSIYTSAAGTFVVDGLISSMYRFKFSSFGAPISNKVATANGFRQDFQNGILISNVATSQTFSLTGAIATYYKGLSAAQLQELGALVADARESSGTLIQDFQSGSIYKTSTGTFRTSGEIGKYDFDRNMPGVPLSEAVTTSYGSRQDFSEGSIMYSAKTGIIAIEGELGKYYRSLSEDQKNRLGISYNSQWSFSTGSSFRIFQGGVVETTQSGSSQVRITPWAVGFDGINFNSKFIDKFIGTDAFYGLGDPTSNIYSANGVLRQEFQKGYITQNGSTMESLFWPTNLGLLGRDYLHTTGKALASLPVVYSFTVDKYTNSFISISAIQGDAKLGLFNSQNQLVANDIQGGNATRFIDTPLAPGSYTVKVTSNSIGNFTLDVSPLNTITVNNPPPQPTSGGVIIITSNPGNSNNQPGGGITIKGSVGNYYYNGISADARQRIGQAKANEVSLGTDIWKQDFQNGTIFHGPKGSYLLVGTLHYNYYNVLSDSDRQRLGMPISNETQDGGYWHQSFENGVLQLVSGAPISWNNNSQSQPQSSYISENAYGRTGTQWAAKVFSWDSSRGKPPADFFNGNTIAELDLGSNDLGNGRKGLKFDVGTGSLRNGLPSDAFAVRAYTQASFDGGQYKFAVRGDDGFQIFAKNINTNEWIYITPKDEWQQAYGSHQEITYGLPQGRYDLHFHYFEGGGNAYFDLSWEKIGGAVSSDGFNAANFRGSVKYGINIRSGPGTSYGVVDSISSGTLSFDGWKAGTSHYDQEAGQYDNRWFRIQGTDKWVASAYINGNPGQYLGATVGSSSGTVNNSGTGNYNYTGASSESIVKGIQTAIFGQESGYNYSAVNPDSGALGIAQVMPANIPSWSREALGFEITPGVFLSNPTLQLKIVNHKLNQYYQTALQVTGGNIDLAVRRVASAWYSGDPNLYISTNPQYFNGNSYPSIASYTLSVLDRFHQNYTFIPQPTTNVSQQLATFQWKPGYSTDLTDSYFLSNVLGNLRNDAKLRLTNEELSKLRSSYSLADFKHFKSKYGDSTVQSNDLFLKDLKGNDSLGTKIKEPTSEDIGFKLLEQNSPLGKVSWFKSLGFNNAAALYENYLNNTGEDYSINVDELLRESGRAASVINFNNRLNEMIQKAKENVNSFHMSGEIIRGFQGSGEIVPVKNIGIDILKLNLPDLASNGFYPQDLNWHLGLGSFDFSVRSTFEWRPDNGNINSRTGYIKLITTLTVADVYNFEWPYIKELSLQQSGLAKNFYTIGTKIDTQLIRHEINTVYA